MTCDHVRLYPESSQQVEQAEVRCAQSRLSDVSLSKSLFLRVSLDVVEGRWREHVAA